MQFLCQSNGTPLESSQKLGQLANPRTLGDSGETRTNGSPGSETAEYEDEDEDEYD
jgi:hypothetical protein